MRTGSKSCNVRPIPFGAQDELKEMDLFADLPPPGTAAKEASSLFGDLPLVAEGNLKTPGSKRQPGKDVTARVSDSESQTSVASKKQRTEASFTCQAFTAERRGERENMQDAHRVDLDLARHTDQPDSCRALHSQLVYFGVFDGHNGSRASQFAAQNLHIILAEKFPKGVVQNLDREVKKCLVDAYKRTDEEFLKKASEASPSWKDGSTGVTILGIGDVIYVANIGDSRAVLCREGEGGKIQAITLTKDHSPINYDERTRIQKAGGVVREGRLMGVLEVSRSFGDGKFKHCGVICAPDVRKCTITKDDRFFLVACDGLWKVFSSEEAVSFILETLKDTSIVPPEDPVPSTTFESRTVVDPREYRCEVACEKMAVEAVKRGCADNVTIMLITITSTSKSV